MSEQRQCEQNGETCGSQEPYPAEIMAGGVLCGGCGRKRPAVKYVLASRVAEPVNAKLPEACIRLRGTSAAQSCDESFADKAIAAARTQAEDDAKPVDEEWLRSIGFLPVVEHLELSCGVAYLDEFRLKWMIAARHFWFSGLVLPHIQTRGDVRRLLSALGVKHE